MLPHAAGISKRKDEAAPSGGHLIFKICISCNFDTLTYSNRPRYEGLSFRCLECEAYTFVIACSKCVFESSEECPLSQLLDRKHEVHKGSSEDERTQNLSLEQEVENES